MATKRPAARGGTAAVAVKVARSLYRRWEGMAPGEREPLRALADGVKNRALDLRGRLDVPEGERDLAQASEELAGAIVESAKADPAVDTTEFDRLREELASELERLAARAGPAAPRRAA